MIRTRAETALRRHGAVAFFFAIGFVAAGLGHPGMLVGGSVGALIGFAARSWYGAATERERVILALLRKQDDCGKGLVARSDGRISGWFLYTTLASMEKRGLIVSWEVDASPLFTNDPPMMRRYYRLTDAGRAAFAT